MKPAIREVTDDNTWDALVASADLGTVYHRSAWLHTIGPDTGGHIHRLVLELNGTPLTIWPIGLLRKGPLRVGGSPLPGWNTAYLGPLFFPACRDKAAAVQTMMRTGPIRRPAFLALRAMDTTLDLTPLGFRKTRDFETYELDLTRDEQTLWDNLKSTCRTRIRKGEKNGLTVREEVDAGYLGDFWAMAVDVFAKSAKRPPFSLATLQRMESNLRARGELIVTTAFLGSERIATLIIPHDGRTAMYFAGGSHSERLDLAPNNLLHWKTILLCRQRGLTKYDFISNRGNPGRFKATFSPNTRTSSTHWEYARSKLIRRFRDLYEYHARKSKSKSVSKMAQNAKVGNHHDSAPTPPMPRAGGNPPSLFFRSAGMVVTD